MTSLKDRLLARIRETGPITFAEFMEAALYDADEGFYARPPIGEDGHYVTSPHVSPAFGDLLARQVGECWDLLGHPSRFALVEVGAGDGTLATQILAAMRSVPELFAVLDYIAVERSAGARRALDDRGLEVRASLDEIEPLTGVLIANEVLDNAPFHRLRRRKGLVEVMVDERDGRLVEVEREPGATSLGALRKEPADGTEQPVSPEWLSFPEGVARILQRGYAFLFDYGFAADEAPGPVHAYREHRVLGDVLDDPGSRDVTAAVDLASVASAAEGAGLQVWGPVSQREALLALGYRLWSAGVRRRQAEAEAEGDHRLSTRLFGERSRASLLTDPAKLGGLSLLAFGTEGLPPPSSVLGDRETGC